MAPESKLRTEAWGQGYTLSKKKSSYLQFERERENIQDRRTGQSYTSLKMVS